jgi:hypothetical protein
MFRGRVVAALPRAARKPCPCIGSRESRFGTLTRNVGGIPAKTGRLSARYPKNKWTTAIPSGDSESLWVSIVEWIWIADER